MDKKLKKRKLSFIAAMRKAFVRSNTYYTVMEGAKSSQKGPRGGTLYECSLCKERFSKSKCEIDHYPLPLTPYDKYQYELTEKQVISRLFCKTDNLRVVCKDNCHLQWTKEQRKLRSEAKKKRKKNGKDT